MRTGADCCKIGGWKDPAAARCAPGHRPGRNGEISMTRKRFSTSTVLATLVMLPVLALPIAGSADETCNSPYMTGLIKGQEDYVHVWTLGVDGWGDGSDKLVTIDINPRSKTY